MSTLTDRYVWGVLRSVPERQRADLEPEIRAMIADAVEARTAAGAAAHTAERDALVELGDPERLAARYTDRPLHLIGPRYFLDYRRLLAVLVPVIAAVVAFAVLLGDTVAGAGIGEPLVHAASAALGAAIQVAFWVTVGFALVERGDARRTESTAWTPDQLPQLPSPGRLSPVELVLGVTANALVIAALVWQQAEAPVTVDGQGFTLFDPVLWSFWMPWFIAVAALQVGFTIVLYLNGRWTVPLATANAVLNAAFAVPAIWLLQQGRLVNPDLVAALEAIAGGAWFGPTAAVIAVVVAVISAWDAIDGFLKAGRSRGAMGLPVMGSVVPRA